jgi:outer membrane protein assembly factor BamD (BamD/ComL family)
VVISDFGLAQNIKKVYKQITKNEIGDANNELKQFSTASLDNKELTLYDLANCLVLCNPLLSNNDPFKSNGMFEKIDFTKSNKSEVNDFLEKFDLSIDKIHDTIYTRILDYAKKQNTEASYTSALTVCLNCFYKEEVTKLQVNSAYNETIKKASISGYKEFISKYPNSEYRNEIQRLEETLAFSNAKTKNSLIGFKNYIEGYSSTSNQYLPHAINLRDSIVFFTLNQNYADFKTFIKENPKSKYSPFAQQALPKLLFTKALKEGSIDLYKRFLVEFPTDTRKDSVLLNLEKLEFEKLVAKPSIDEIELFKKNYPNTRFMQEVSELVAELSDNDIKRLGFHGNVKSSVVNRYKSNFDNQSNQIVKGEKLGVFKYIFNENRNLLELHHEYQTGKIFEKYDGNGKIVEQLEYDLKGSIITRDTYKYDETGNKIELLIYVHGKISFRHTYKYNEDGKILEELNYNYRLDGSVIDRITKKYDLKGNLIESTDYYMVSGNVDHFIYKYDENGKLVEEYFSNGDISFVRETNKYDGKGNKLESSKYLKNGRLYDHETYNYNENGNLLEHSRYLEGNLKNQEKYTYDERGNVLEFWKLTPSSLRQGQLSQLLLEETNKYDGKGNRIEHSTDVSHDFRSHETYKYDETGNMIEKSRVSQKELYKYDERGELLEYSKYDSKGILVEKELSKYDKEGRKIEFYYPKTKMKIICNYSTQGCDLVVTYSGSTTEQALLKYDTNYNIINFAEYSHNSQSFDKDWFNGKFKLPDINKNGWGDFFETEIEYYK